MKPSHVALTIDSIAVKLRRPLMIHGAPGVGKSAVVKQAFRALRAKYVRNAGLSEDDESAALAAPDSDGTYFGMVDFRAALRDAVDIMGLPGARVEDTASGPQHVTFYNLPAGLPRDPKSRGILFLDEINSAPQQTQAALYQLVLDRRVGDYVVPEGWSIVAAGNRKDDRGVVHRMPDPLVDRFFHVDFETHVDDWCEWATAEGIRPEVVAFVRARPQLLHNHDTARKCHAFSTPRGWVDVNAVMALSEEAREVRAIESALVTGRVGDGAASEFMAFLNLFRNMVSPDEVLRNPKTAPVPDKVDIAYALAEALGRRATVKNIAAVLTFAARMPPEYEQLLVSRMPLIDPALSSTAEYTGWMARNEKRLAARR